MDYPTITDVHEGLERKRFSAVEIAQAHLDRIAARDGVIGSYLHTMSPDALATAARVDAAIARGETIDALAGIPIAVKDNMLVAGHPATAGSKILEPYVAAYDATAVAKLKATDAVLVGKTNCDEFAMGSSNEFSAYKPVRNPWDHDRVPGGSSGGSAAAVAADLAVAALGSDTGGSVRQPAALCGVVGLKPTYGSVSRYGLMAMSSSFDVIGSFTRTVRDAETMFRAIAGRDARDATSADAPPKVGRRPRAGFRDLRVGIPKEYFASGIDPDIEQAVHAAVRVIEGLGCPITEVTLPHTKYGLPVYYVLMPSEVSANLSRFDGMRYGASLARTEPLAALDEVYRATRAQGFGAEPRRRIMLGTYALSTGYADQYYKRALAVRKRLQRDFQHAFADVDVLVTPVTPSPAWAFGAKTDDPLAMYLSDVFTVSANVAGIPGMSLPCGFVERPRVSPPTSGRGSAEGVGKVRLPVGLQLMSTWFDEDALFMLGEAYQQATDWHTRRPPTDVIARNGAAA